MSGDIMIKKTILAIFITSFGLSCFAADADLTIKGFQNLEKIQKLNVINQLSAIADNDGVEFSEKWPIEYFQNNGKASLTLMIEKYKNVYFFPLSLKIFKATRLFLSNFAGEHKETFNWS